MNIYKYKFQRPCLVDGATICYTLEIKTYEQLMVEDIMAFATEEPCIQENIANEYYGMFGGEQTMIGVHSGVQLITLRGSI